MKHSRLFAAAGMAAVLFLSACNSANATFRADAEAYLRQNIGDISPQDPVLGGSFRVTSIVWLDDDTARVTYEDGHIQLVGEADIQRNNNKIEIKHFRLNDDSNAKVRFRGDAETELRNNFASVVTGMSIGTSATVTGVEWVDDDTLRVMYTDAGASGTATVDVQIRNNKITFTDFEPEDDDDEEASSSARMSSSAKTSSSRMSSSAMTSSRISSSAMSVSSRARAGAGQFCGGIAGVLCAEGLTCQYDGSYPDAGGTCVTP